MPKTRTQGLLAVSLLLIAGIVGGGTYTLWMRLTRPAPGPRRATLVAMPAAGAAQDSSPESIDVRPRVMPRIKSGTVIGKEGARNWTDLVLHGVPRVADGDVEKVSATLSRLVSLFHLTILADVDLETSQPGTYRLGDVAVGLAMKINGREVVVSSKSQQALGAKLSLIDRNALSGNEACLDQALQVARTPTMVIFDATAIMRLGDENRNVIDRHALVVSPTNGRLTTFVWALDRDKNGNNELVGDKIRILPRGLREDRRLYVDSRRFVLGLPSQEAFALVDLPPGDTIKPSDALRTAAESTLQTPADVTRLQGLLAAATTQSPAETKADEQRAAARQPRDL
jgi:hypothetical protein